MKNIHLYTGLFLVLVMIFLSVAIYSQRSQYDQFDDAIDAYSDLVIIPDTIPFEDDSDDTDGVGDTSPMDGTYDTAPMNGGPMPISILSPGITLDPVGGCPTLNPDRVLTDTGNVPVEDGTKQYITENKITCADGKIILETKITENTIATGASDSVTESVTIQCVMPQDSQSSDPSTINYWLNPPLEADLNTLPPLAEKTSTVVSACGAVPQDQQQFISNPEVLSSPNYDAATYITKGVCIPPRGPGDTILAFHVADCGASAAGSVCQPPATTGQAATCSPGDPLALLAEGSMASYTCQVILGFVEGATVGEGGLHVPLGSELTYTVVITNDGAVPLEVPREQYEGVNAVTTGIGDLSSTDVMQKLIEEFTSGQTEESILKFVSSTPIAKTPEKEHFRFWTYPGDNLKELMPGQIQVLTVHLVADKWGYAGYQYFPAYSSNPAALTDDMPAEETPPEIRGAKGPVSIGGPIEPSDTTTTISAKECIGAPVVVLNADGTVPIKYTDTSSSGTASSNVGLTSQLKEPTKTYSVGDVITYTVQLENKESSPATFMVVNQYCSGAFERLSSSVDLVSMVQKIGPYCPSGKSIQDTYTVNVNAGETKTLEVTLEALVEGNVENYFSLANQPAVHTSTFVLIKGGAGFTTYLVIGGVVLIVGLAAFFIFRKRKSSSVTPPV